MDRIRIAHRFFEKRLFYSLKSKLILSFLAISIIPLATVVTLAFFQFQEALRSQTSNQLTVMRDLKIDQVKTYLRQIEQDIKLVAELPNVKTAIQQLEISVRGQGLNQVRRMGFLGRPDLLYLEAYHPYAVYHAKYHAFFRELVQTKGYADIWLVSPEGNIIYTYAKRNDFATNLFKVSYQDILPNQFFRNLLAHGQTGQMQMTDFVSYPPAGDIPVIFFGAPILDDDKILGVLIYEVPLDQINDLMQAHTGFWKTGETYLVGEDKFSRTKTRFGEEVNFFDQKVDTLAIQKGVLGESGVAIIEDYRGIPVLSAYQALELNGFKWVLLAEVDKSEAFGPSNHLGSLMASIIVVTALAVMCVGLYIGSSIAEPIAELAETSTQIASGDLELRARSGSRDEIGHLAEAFNSMTDQLSELIGSLEQQIAERKQVEQALRESEDRYRGLFENSPISLWEEDFSEGKEYFESLRKSGIMDFRAYFENNPEAVTHCAGLVKVLDVNKATLELLRAKNKDELLAGLPNIFTEDSLAVFREELIVLAEGGQRFESEAIQLALTGEEKQVALQLSVAPGYEDSLGKVLVSLLDITERKQAESNLKESEERYRAIVAGFDGLIYVCSQDYRVEFMNDRFVKRTGYYPIGELCYKALHELDAVCPWCVNERVSKGETVRWEVKSPKDDRWYYVVNTPIYHADGRVSKQAMILDITERKKTEEELDKHREHLEELVRERTAELEIANKELEAFAYSVSHDLRAPLRHIDGFIGLLQKRTMKALDEQSRYYMDIISDSANRMGVLTDDLLSFSQMGRKPMSYEHVDLDELIHEIIRELEQETKNRNIQWLHDDLPVVTGDRSMLRIVMVNLISNALKFTRPVKQTEIEIGCMPDTKKETVIFVRDNGVGFDMNYADKLFNVFQRLHREDEFEGTGIGLANVQRIIDRHGGRTWATGELNQGATFYFSIPQI